MFKDKHLQVKVMKDPAFTPISDEVKNPLILDLNILIQDNLKSVVGGVITVMVARKVLNTACELVLIKAGK